MAAALDVLYAVIEAAGVALALAVVLMLVDLRARHRPFSEGRAIAPSAPPGPTEGLRGWAGDVASTALVLAVTFAIVLALAFGVVFLVGGST